MPVRGSRSARNSSGRRYKASFGRFFLEGYSDRRGKSPPRDPQVTTRPRSRVRTVNPASRSNRSLVGASLRRLAGEIVPARDKVPEEGELPIDAVETPTQLRQAGFDGP